MTFSGKNGIGMQRYLQRYMPRYLQRYMPRCMHATLHATLVPLFPEKVPNQLLTYNIYGMFIAPPPRIIVHDPNLQRYNEATRSPY